MHTRPGGPKLEDNSKNKHKTPKQNKQKHNSFQFPQSRHQVLSFMSHYNTLLRIYNGAHQKPQQ